MQGAGEGAYDEDKELADSLRSALGAGYEVRYPAMPDDGDVPYARWRERIDFELAGMPGPVVLAGHSVGASVLIKWVSEQGREHPIAGVFLAECPFWGGAGWRYEGWEGLALPPDAAAKLPEGLPIYLYHCRDDEIVPFDHLALYARALPHATVRAFDAGGHQLDGDLSAMARDIAALHS